MFFHFQSLSADGADTSHNFGFCDLAEVDWVDSDGVGLVPSDE